jgi:tetratricopeptide (TPR) repeat protein
MRPSRLRLGLFVVFSVVGGVARAVADENQVQSGDYMPVVQAIARIRQQTEDVKAHNFQAMTARADHWEGAGAEAFRAQLQSGRLKQNSDRLIGDVRDNIIGNLQKRDPNSLVSVKEVENYGPAFNTYTKAIRDALWGEAQDAGLKRADFPNDRAFQRAVQAKLGADDWKEVIAKIEPVHKQILADMTDPKGDPKLPGPVRMMDTNIQTQLGANLKDSEHGGGTEVKHPPTDTPPGTGTGTGAVTPNGPAGPTQDAGNHLAFGDVGGANAVLAGAAASGSADAQGYALMGGMAYDEGRYSDAASAARSALQLDPKNTEANTVLHFSEGRVDGAGGGGPASKDGAASSGERGIAGGGAASGGRATFGGFVGSGASLAPTDAQRGAAARLSAEQAQKAAANAIGLHDLTGAMAFIERGLALNPKDPALLHLRGTVYAKQHDYQKALADEKSALELDPRNPEILKAMGLDQLRGGMYKDALASANAYIEAHPNEAYGYALRAQAYARLGDHESYLADMRRAAELDPFYQEASAHPSNIQNPTDADLLFLFPGEEGPKTAAQPAGRARQFSWVVGASILGGLLMAIGLLQTVLAPLKEQVSSVFTRITRTGPTLGALDNDALADASPTGLIRGQYEITRPIGAGGMGMVYEGTDRSLGRRVAIKKMRDELRADPRERARFVSEAKTVAALHHPNIVDIFAIADDASDVYLIFEFVDGKTVHDLVQTAGKLTPEQTAAIVAAAAVGLDDAHSKGVIHRDMKPSNVMIDGNGKVKVMDFGIARMAKDAMTRYTNTNTIVGTPPYMAPEQEQGQVRRESDVYALAVCAYEMLTGRLPFGGIGGGMLLNKINMSYVPPSRETAGLPAALDEVFARAFQADPDQRYHAPAEFAAALRSALAPGVRA